MGIIKMKSFEFIRCHKQDSRIVWGERNALNLCGCETKWGKKR